MKIKMLCGISGPEIVAKPGEEIEWPDDSEAKRMIEAGIAEAVAVKPVKKAETRKK